MKNKVDLPTVFTRFADGAPTVFRYSCSHYKHPALLGYTRMWVQFTLCSFLISWQFALTLKLTGRSLRERPPRNWKGTFLKGAQNRMNELRIRYVSDGTSAKLKELARKNGFSSLQGYLLNIVTRVAESNEVEDLDRHYRELQNRMMEQLNANTKALQTFVELYGGEEED